MAGLINWKKQPIPASNPDSDHLYVGIDSSDDMLYTKDDVGVVTKFPTLAQISGVVLTTILTGLTIVTGSAITDADNILTAFGKLQGQINQLFELVSKVSAGSSVGLVNQSTAFAQFTRLSKVVATAGKYKLSWSYTWSLNDTTQDFIARVQQNDTTDLMNHRQEPKDSGGTGIVLDVVGGGTVNTGTDQVHQESGFILIDLTPGSYDFDLDWTSSVVDLEAAIYQGYLTLERHD